MSKSKNKRKAAIRGGIGINVGGTGKTANPETVAETAKSVVKVLEAGHKSRADQETIRHALTVVDKAAAAVAHGANQTSITNSCVSDIR